MLGKGDAQVNSGEFYRSREDNYVAENKSFPAEVYRKPFEENALGLETSDYGSEVTSLQKKKETPKNNADGSAKTLVDKMFNSIRSIATTATVAVSAVVVTTTVMTNTMNVDLKSMDVGYDYVEYEVEISDMGDEDCYVIVSSPGKTEEETEVVENGTYKARVEGLKPGWEYTLSIVTRDAVLGDITHFQCKFQTEKHQEYAPDPPDSYPGRYILPDASDVTLDWGAGVLRVPITFENIEGKYYYKLVVRDQSGNAFGEFTGNSDAAAVIDISSGDGLYNVYFEIYGIGANSEKLITRHDLGLYSILYPKVDIIDILLAGENRIRINYNTVNATNVTLRIAYQGGGYDDITLTQSEIAQGYVEVTVPDTETAFTVMPIIDTGTGVIESSGIKKEFLNNLEIDPVVHLADDKMSIDFRVKAITNGAMYLQVESSHPAVASGAYDLWNGLSTVYYSDRAEITFTLYLTDGVGTRLSNEVTLTVDTTKPADIPSYTLNYKNPNEVGVTYNDDGTMNVYIVTDFACEDESYYYEIRLGNYSLKSRDRIAVIKDLPYDTYSLQYAVCFERNGQQHTVMTVTPSGMVNELYFYANCELSGTTFEISVEESHNLDLNTIKVISAGGQEISIAENDFIANGYGAKTASITFDSAPEHVVIQVMISTGSGMSQVDEYEGSLYTYFEETIYPI